MAVLPEIDRINANLAKMAEGRKVRYLSTNDKLAGPDGKLYDGGMNTKDQLHRTVKGYQVWADALKPIFYRIARAAGRRGSRASADRRSVRTAGKPTRAFEITVPPTA
jgi:hypothetical protein